MLRGLPSMTSALEGGRGVVEKWTRVLISCVIMYVTRGEEGVKKLEIFMDIIDGSPLSFFPYPVGHPEHEHCTTLRCTAEQMSTNLAI